MKVKANIEIKAGKTEHPDKTWEEIVEMTKKFNEAQAIKENV